MKIFLKKRKVIGVWTELQNK